MKVIVHMRKCAWCRLRFMPADWIPCRRSNLCSMKCADALAKSIGERGIDPIKTAQLFADVPRGT